MAKDLNKLMPLYSETFQSSNWDDKTALEKYLTRALDQGQMDGIKIEPKGAPIRQGVNEPWVTVGPIEISAAFGSATVELILKKEGSKWLVTDMTVQEH